MTIKNNKEAYRIALFLAITAPNGKLAAECESLAASLEETLTRREIKRIKLGVTSALEFAKQIEWEKFDFSYSHKHVKKILEQIQLRGDGESIKEAALSDKYMLEGDDNAYANHDYRKGDGV